MENIEFFLSKFARIYLIKDLHEHKGIEDEGVVLCFLCSSHTSCDWINDEEWLLCLVSELEQRMSTEKHNTKHCDLE